MGMRRTFALAAAVVVLGSGAAQAATAIDVDNLLEGPTNLGGSGFGASSRVLEDDRRTFSAYQTWTVGKSGTLDKIDIFGNAVRSWSLDGVNFVQDEDFLVTLTVYGGGSVYSPGAVELGSVSKSASELGAIFKTTSFDFSALQISAAVGDVLTFHMSVEECAEIYYCEAGWMNMYLINGIGDTGGYSEGAGYSKSAFGLNYSPMDANFRTWMSAVPEPSTWAMMITGFGLTGAALRRRVAVRTAA